jgi:hypothetical protein
MKTSHSVNANAAAQQYDIHLMLPQYAILQMQPTTPQPPS